jgi:hypothetical protein
VITAGVRITGLLKRFMPRSSVKLKRHPKSKMTLTSMKMNWQRWTFLIGLKIRYTSLYCNLGVDGRRYNFPAVAG